MFFGEFWEHVIGSLKLCFFLGGRRSVSGISFLLLTLFLAIDVGGRGRWLLDMVCSLTSYDFVMNIYFYLMISR